MGRLTNLQSLSIQWGHNLSGDLSPLAGLTSLQSLSLAACYNLSGVPACRPHLDSIAQPRRVPAAQRRPVSACQPHLAPIAQPVLLWRSPVCPGRILVAYVERTLPVRLRRWMICPLKSAASPTMKTSWVKSVPITRKVWPTNRRGGQGLVPRNGGVGKTQLCRRMRNLPFDPSVPTTHGIQLGEMTATLENFPEPVDLWDFGGQDIYHGSHALFLHVEFGR